jgi:hypothetical protein
MKTLSVWFLAIAVAGASAWAQVPIGSELTLNSPACKTTKAERPKLPPKLPKENPNFDTDQEYFYDFNGDGWCDYALGVPYPFNSKMNSFSVEDILLLGNQDRWGKALKGKNDYKFMVSLLHSPWVSFRPDLTDIKLVYSKSGGAPYVIGIYSGNDNEYLQNDTHRKNPAYCDKEGKQRIDFFTPQYLTVYRWDDTVGTFKKVEESTRKAILEFEFEEETHRCISRLQKRK